MASSTTEKPRSKSKSVKTKSGQEHTRESVIAAVKSYAEQHDGQAPTSSEWWPARLRQFKAAAEQAGDRKKAREFEAAAKRAERAGYPIPPTVQRLFGSWAKGLKAAGLKPRRS